MGSAPTLARGRPGRQIGPPSTSSSSRRWWLQEVLRRIPPAQSELLLLTAMHHDPRQLIVRDHRGPNGPAPAWDEAEGPAAGVGATRIAKAKRGLGPRAIVSVGTG